MSILWKQGDLVTPEHIKALDLPKALTPTPQRLVVASHSCDIAADKAIEPNVELLVAQTVDVKHAQYRNGHGIRQLHVPASSPNDIEWLQLQISARVLVAKEALFANNPWTNCVIPRKERNVLRFWLAQRYSRCAFPDAFIRALKNRGVEKHFDKLAKRHSGVLIGIYFDLDDDTEHTAISDPYELGITLVYDVDDANHAEAAQQAADRLKTIFWQRCYDGKDWIDIELLYCNASSEEAFSLRDARMFRRWRFEYRSISGEPRDTSE